MAHSESRFPGKTLTWMETGFLFVRPKYAAISKVLKLLLVREKLCFNHKPKQHYSSKTRTSSKTTISFSEILALACPEKMIKPFARLFGRQL
jgi:hypothetical protein